MYNRRRKTRTVATAIGVVALMLLLAGQPQAGVILSPVAVVNNTLGTYGGHIDRVMDGSGLPPFTSGVTDYNTYIGTGPTHATFQDSNAWSSQSGILTGDIDFDLGGTFLLDQISLWNQGNTQSINSFTIFTSSDPTFASAVNAGTFTAAMSQSASSFALVPSTAEFARLRINSNYGSGGFTTLGDIVFDATPAAGVIPEPATLSLLGLGGLALLRRRRTR